MRAMTAGVVRAAVFIGPGQTRVERVALPEPGPHDVRVRLEGCGICGSNLPVWQGQPWTAYPLEPGAPGHEGWGRIEALGREVRHLAVGDRVAILSYHAFAEGDMAPADAVVRLPAALDSKPFPGEPLGCAVNILRRSEIRPGQRLAIIGIGFMGALLTGLAVQAGALVMAISRRPFALEMARTFGAAETIRMDDHAKVIERVKALTENQGCDRVIEAVGQQPALDLAGELTRVRGRLIIAGYHQDGARQVNLQLWNWRGLDVVNAHERAPEIFIEGMRAAVDLVTSGKLDPLPLYTHRFDLDQLPEAFEAMRQRPDGFLKAWIVP